MLLFKYRYIDFSHLAKLLLAAAFLLPLATIAAMPPALQQELQKSRVDLSGLSIYVSKVNAASAWITHDHKTARNPGSAIKILTSAVALEKLGPAYTWKTEFYADQMPVNGVVNGNLYIKGYGDPYVTVERYWAMIQELRNLGIRQISGDVILDAGYFARPNGGTQDFDGKENRSYNVLPYAALVNFQSLRLHFRPDGASVKIHSYPPVSSIRIINRLRLVKGRCGAWKQRIRFQSEMHAGYEKLIVDGRYAKSCGENATYRAVQNSANYTAGLFVSLWRQQGGLVKGKIRNGRVPPTAKILLSMPSLTLADIVRRINKYSNNVMTRHLLLTVVAESKVIPAQEQRGQGIVQRWLSAQRIPAAGFRMENGAGLSRMTRISAFQLGRVLKTVYRKPYMPELMSSLPITGVDGTMANRKLIEESNGRMHLKTGLLDNVRSTAGYILNPRGNRYVIVIFHNNKSASTWRGKRLQNKILNWVYRNSP